MRVVTLDIEIRKPIPERDGKADWEYAKSGRCGISAVTLYDTVTGRYHTYDDRSMVPLMQHLNSADIIVGFNNIEFDKRVIEAVSGESILPEQVDILYEFKNNFSIKGGGWKLGMVCERTLGIGKTGSGESAPMLAAAGRYGELFDYNINDVHLTRLLFNHIQEHGWVVGPDGTKQSMEIFAVGKEVRA